MRRNIAVERGRDIDIVPVEQREMRIGQRLEVGADDELPFGEARAALDDRGDQVEPERRFAALELDLDAVGVEPVEAGEDRRQRVLAPVESGSVGIDPRYLAIARSEERSGGTGWARTGRYGGE